MGNAIEDLFDEVLGNIDSIETDDEYGIVQEAKDKVYELQDKVGFLAPLCQHDHYYQKLKEIIETQAQRGNLIELVNYLDNKYG